MSIKADSVTRLAADFPAPMRSPDGLRHEYDCGCQVRRDPGGGYFLHACRLHNAAPDLLEACKWALPFLEDEDKRRLPPNLATAGCPLTQAVRAAIAKATGEPR